MYLSSCSNWLVSNNHFCHLQMSNKFEKNKCNHCKRSRDGKKAASAWCSATRIWGWLKQVFWLRPCVPALRLPMNPSGDAQAGCELSTQEVVRHPRSRPWIPQFLSSLPPWAPRLSRPPQRWSPAAAAVFLHPWPASPPLSVSPAVMVSDDQNSSGQWWSQQ